MPRRQEASREDGGSGGDIGPPWHRLAPHEPRRVATSLGLVLAQTGGRGVFLEPKGRGRREGRQRSFRGAKPDGSAFAVGQTDVRGHRGAAEQRQTYQSAEGETAGQQTTECSAKHSISLPRTLQLNLYAAPGRMSIEENARGGVTVAAARPGGETHGGFLPTSVVLGRAGRLRAFLLDGHETVR